VAVFISYAEEDGALARLLAEYLEQNGHLAWYYERDSVPGPTYFRQVQAAIARADAFLIILSDVSIGSRQVAGELLFAHESAKSLLPVLCGLTFEDLKARRSDWAMLLGGAVAVALSPDSPASDFVPLLRGLQMMSPGPDLLVVTPPRTSPARGRSRLSVYTIGAAILVASAIVTVPFVWSVVRKEPPRPESEDTIPAAVAPPPGGSPDASAGGAQPSSPPARRPPRPGHDRRSRRTAKPPSDPRTTGGSGPPNLDPYHKNIVDRADRARQTIENELR
jgi:hypothetical protein